jgi:hypothetical protein
LTFAIGDHNNPSTALPPEEPRAALGECPLPPVAEKDLVAASGQFLVTTDTNHAIGDLAVEFVGRTS